MCQMSTETIALIRTCQENRRRQSIKKNDGHGRTGEEKKGRPRLRRTDHNREYMTKYELTADMTEIKQYWTMMETTGPRRSVDDL